MYHPIHDILVSEVGSSDHIGFFSSGYDNNKSDLRLHWVLYCHIMETEQMMACLLAEIITGQEYMKEMNKMKDKIKEDMNTNRKANRENLKEMREEIKS
jgi:hypothetical protein